MQFGMFAVLIGAMFLTACARTLPQVDEAALGQNMPRIEEGASPLLAWSGARNEVSTYWGKLSVSVRAEVWLPPVWKQPGDERWRVTAETGQGVRLPFIGVVRPYVSEKGETLAELWPGLNLTRAPDGLYIIIYPNIVADDGKVVSVAPVAAVREIRGSAFKPFEIKIPLLPAQESPLTPKPDWQPPKPPSGTPIPVN